MALVDLFWPVAYGMVATAVCAWIVPGLEGRTAGLAFLLFATTFFLVSKFVIGRREVG